MDVRTVAVTLAVVGAIFAFFLSFALFSDRIGGWPGGYVVSGVFGVAAFVVVLPVARRYLSKPAEPKPPETPPRAHTTIVHTPVQVNVPVNVRIEPEIAAKQEALLPAEKEEMPPAATPPSAPTPSPLASTDEIFDSLPFEETLFDDVVEVGTGREGCWKYELPLEAGDVLEADLHVLDGEDINWMVMSKKKLFEWLDGGDPVSVAGEQNVRARPIKWTARKGTWYSSSTRSLSTTPGRSRFDFGWFADPRSPPEALPWRE